MEIKKIKQLSYRTNHVCELIKVSMSECEKLRKTLHNLKRVKIVPPIDYIVIVESIKLKNTIKVILREKNQLKKDNAKEKKAIESDPQSKLQNRIPHLNCCWENCGHISPTVVALQERVSIDHIVTQQRSNLTPHWKLYMPKGEDVKTPQGLIPRHPLTLWD